MSKRAKDPCKVNACKIQACLSANHYQEDKCLDVLEQMRLCCVKWQHVESLTCSGIDLSRSFLPDSVNNQAASAAKEASQTK